MSETTDVREAGKTKQGSCETSPAAVETQQELTEGRAIEEFEARKKRLNDALDSFRRGVAKAKKIADERKIEIRASFDDLNVQSTPGNSDARDVHQTPKDRTTGIIERELSACMREIERAIEEIFQ